jgi:serine phosphatase RsbU (regulator of sigma subunit)
VDPNVRYTCGVDTLAPGDFLLIFTDGLVEAVNEVDEEFGEARLLGALKVCSRESAESTLKDVMTAVDAFAGRTRQHDDITCLVLRVV